MALFATSVILNFHYRKHRMPNCLRKLIFTYLGRIVGIKSKPYPPLPSTRKNNQKNGPNGNCELKTMKLIQNETLESELNDSNHIKETHILDDHETADFDRHGDENLDENDPDVMEANSVEWQKAARILDRFVLVVGVLLSVFTFGAIFIQAPRVRNGLLGTTVKSLEQSL